MSNEDTINKMLSYCQKIQTYSAGLDEEQFYSSLMPTEACVFCFIQIGELVTKFDPEFLKANPQIAWKEIRGVRHRIVHDYENINLFVLWEIIQNDLPDLIAKLNRLLP